MAIIHLEDGVPPSKSRMVIYEESDADDVIAGGSKITTITPPVGHIWKITSLYLDAKPPFLAGGGTHQWMVGNAVSAMLRGISTFASNVEWDASMWTVANSSKAPSSEIAALYTLINSVFDSNNPIVIIYYNDTDKTAADTRNIEIVIEETPKI